MNEVDIAWAAGFLEGEGCFAWYDKISPSRRFRQILVSAVQKDREPLDRLRQIFSAGKITESHKKQTDNTYWRWQANGQEAASIMRAVFPFMCLRRKEKIYESLHSYESHLRDMTDKREKPTCNNGHLWSENTGIRKRGVGQGHRYCKACQREWQAAYRERKVQQHN